MTPCPPPQGEPYAGPWGRETFPREGLAPFPNITHDPPGGGPPRRPRHAGPLGRAVNGAEGSSISQLHKHFSPERSPNLNTTARPRKDPTNANR